MKAPTSIYSGGASGEPASPSAPGGDNHKTVVPPQPGPPRSDKPLDTSHGRRRPTRPTEPDISTKVAREPPVLTAMVNKPAGQEGSRGHPSNVVPYIQIGHISRIHPGAPLGTRTTRFMAPSRGGAGGTRTAAVSTLYDSGARTLRIGRSESAPGLPPRSETDLGYSVGLADRTQLGRRRGQLGRLGSSYPPAAHVCDLGFPVQLGTSWVAARPRVLKSALSWAVGGHEHNPLGATTSAHHPISRIRSRVLPRHRARPTAGVRRTGHQRPGRTHDRRTASATAPGPTGRPGSAEDPARRRPARCAGHTAHP
jgi:hypothetical protein